MVRLMAVKIQIYGYTGYVYCQYLKKKCAFRQVPNKYSDFDKIRLGRGHHMVES